MKFYLYSKFIKFKIDFFFLCQDTNMKWAVVIFQIRTDLFQDFCNSDFGTSAHRFGCHI
jgi:hypothetical protein